MKKTLADARDNFATSFAVFLFLWSISLGMEAAAYLIDERIGQHLTDWANAPYVLGFLPFLFSAIVYSRRRGPISLNQAARSFAHSYVTETIRQSALVAFGVTVILVAVLDSRADHTNLPPDFFIKLPGVALLATFSLSFFYLNRSSDAGEIDREKSGRE